MLTSMEFRKEELQPKSQMRTCTSRPAAPAMQISASDPGEEIKNKILKIGVNKCARESGFDRKNFIRKLVRGVPVKRNSYNEFVPGCRATS